MNLQQTVGVNKHIVNQDIQNGQIC